MRLFDQPRAFDALFADRKQRDAEIFDIQKLLRIECGYHGAIMQMFRHGLEAVLREAKLMDRSSL